MARLALVCCAGLVLALAAVPAHAQAALDKQMRDIETALKAGEASAVQRQRQSAGKMPPPARETAKSADGHDWTGGYVGVSGGVGGARTKIRVQLPNSSLSD